MRQPSTLAFAAALLAALNLVTPTLAEEPVTSPQRPAARSAPVLKHPEANITPGLRSRLLAVDNLQGLPTPDRLRPWGSKAYQHTEQACRGPYDLDGFGYLDYSFPRRYSNRLSTGKYLLKVPTDLPHSVVDRLYLTDHQALRIRRQLKVRAAYLKAQNDSGEMLLALIGADAVISQAPNKAAELLAYKRYWSTPDNFGKKAPRRLVDAHRKKVGQALKRVPGAPGAALRAYLARSFIGVAVFIAAVVPVTTHNIVYRSEELRHIEDFDTLVKEGRAVTRSLTIIPTPEVNFVRQSIHLIQQDGDEEIPIEMISCISALATDL